MARGSKNSAQTNSKQKQDASFGRMALKDAPARKNARAQKAASAAHAEEPQRQPRIFDDRTKRDIVGVVFAVAAVALFVCAVMPPSGFVTEVLAAGMHLLLGVGAYVVPFVMATVGVCLLVRTEENASLGWRMGVGASMIMLAFMVMMSLLVPHAADDPNMLFAPEMLVLRGGYVGAGIAWVFLKAFGVIIGCVLTAGLAVAGAVIIGFSLSGALQRMREAGSAMRDAHERRQAAREVVRQAAQAAQLDQAGQMGQPGAEYQGEAPAVMAPVNAKRKGKGPFAALGFMADTSQRVFDEPEEEPARIRRADPIPHVPRDLSRPRRASQSLTTQLLDESRTQVGGPHAKRVDAYWPSDYAFNAKEAARMGIFAESESNHLESGMVIEPPEITAAREARAAAEAAQAAETAVLASPGRQDGAAGAAASEEGAAGAGQANQAKTQIIGAFGRDFRAPSDMPKPATRLLGEEEAADAAAAKAFPRAETQVFTGMQSQSARPMTRKLTQPSASAQAAAKPARSVASGNAGARAAQDGFVLPAFSLIKHTEHAAEADEAELRDTAADLQGTLEDFNIQAKVVGWVAGPTVTLFKVDLPSGVRVSRIMALQDDIALALAAPGVRIFAPIPGTNHVGIEVPNRTRQNVLLGDVIKDAVGSPLEMAIGKDVEGHSIVTDLAKMPHLLIGGTTGSGKSVAINAMIMSILMRATPDEVRFIMIDPKRVEFTPYNGIPHLYVPVVTENKEAASALAWGVAEMERRLKVMSKAAVRNISQYNAKVASGAFDTEEGDDQAEPVKKMPYIVIVIDELADLMMNVGKEVELSISRIAQLARAAGIHMIVATQRPSTNVVTGLIKANITNRIAFNVASGIDSRVILDTPGAENLIGLGDMLFSKPEYAKPQRLQGCFVSEAEIEAVVEHLKSQGEPEYHQEILQTNVIGLGSSMPDGSGGTSTADDPLLWEAADIVVSSGLGSTSNIQRRLSVGYSRAGRIMDMLEEKGIVGPPNGSRPREVLVDAMELEGLKAFEAHDEAGF